MSLAQAASAKKFSTKEAWGYGILSTIGMGLVGLVCSGCVVYIKKRANKNFNLYILLLISFAIGSLLGDATRHMLPVGFGVHKHAGEEAEHEETAEHEEEAKANEDAQAILLMLGILCFFFLERFMAKYHIKHSHGIIGSLHNQKKPDEERASADQKSKAANQKEEDEKQKGSSNDPEKKYLEAPAKDVKIEIK